MQTILDQTYIIKKVRTVFFSSPVATLPSSLPPRASPPLTPPSRRRGQQGVFSLLFRATGATRVFRAAVPMTAAPQRGKKYPSLEGRENKEG